MSVVDDFGTRPHLPATERWFAVVERGAATEFVAEHAASCETKWRSAVPRHAWSGGWRALQRRADSRALNDTRGE